MIKVCHIITKLDLGGAQQNTLYTVKHLDRNQFLPLLITGTEGILVKEAERYDDVRKYYIPSLLREIRPYSDVNAFAHIRRVLRQEIAREPRRPCIVHTHSSKAGILGRWAAKSVGISHILHSIHGFGFHRYQSWSRRWLFVMLERLTSEITSRFIAVSSANIETGVRLKLFPPSRVSLIRSGIDTARFQEYADDSRPNFQQWRGAKCKDLALPPHQHLVGIVACFKPQKAPLDFVRVIKRIVESMPDVHAVMVGDGILRPEIEALIADYDLEKKISLLGWRTDVPELLPLCDVLVLTSLWEGLPRVCPQAMAAALPIVATHVDGIPEAVHDGINGFLRPPGDIEGIAEKVMYLLQHPDIAKRMGLEGRQRVGEFGIQRMIQQQEELYRSLVSNSIR